jgi:chromosome segregation ATPase
MSTSSLKQLTTLAQEIYDECLPSAELDRSLAKLLTEIPAVIGDLGWLSAHHYGDDLEVNDHRESLLALCSEAATVFGAAMLNLSVHVRASSSLETLSRRLLSLRSLLSEQVEGLTAIEEELSLRLNDPDLALIEMNKRRLRLLSTPQHSSAELINAARTLEKLRAETQRAEQAQMKQEEESSALRNRLSRAQEVTADLKREELTLSAQLDHELCEEKRLRAHIEALTSELETVSARLTSLRGALSALESDPRSKIRASIASALAALPEDSVERS